MKMNKRRGLCSYASRVFYLLKETNMKSNKKLCYSSRSTKYSCVIVIEVHLKINPQFYTEGYLF
ncbi:hypothetical protein HMPREF0083_05596 [Aneurinibacillus aneurinilyticus ATCC 12856]|uniref:Uncharacterized protein n=1 Tax=Aneurinibacillus aneurinilyticus ATCC 12856 TaxID=649747 RepID=U1Y3V6_ANEAE|nr:hypothetical protein HMPREF0083_05596 [Aneurinibacillus aneurinilyticus ATCC 12856]